MLVYIYMTLTLTPPTSRDLAIVLCRVFYSLPLPPAKRLRSLRDKSTLGTSSHHSRRRGFALETLRVQSSGKHRQTN